MNFKGTSIVALAFLGLSLLPSLAAAVPITIEDTITQEQFDRNGYLRGTLGFGPNARLDYTHPGDGGTFPDLEHLVEATLTITTKDDRDRAYEYGFVFTEGQWWASQPLPIGGPQVFNVAIEQITDDGTLDVTIVAFLGDFYVTKSVLKLTYDVPERSAPVPEPGTLLLMGSGLLGTATFLRKKFF